ncbi:Outer membrane efflux protein [Aquisphaera giovannonii]|uniref:Outer membrane efflux protein n=1 Tax=Aquisphaera giovannonii TaxID=406548 RepID=A0A5B9VYF8_9BACT|nr:TolC family protein [Aquisphaera giovannonii]QEH33406.1 Outer membrane efflux protein [Aquisphaera giovannonii]
MKSNSIARIAILGLPLALGAADPPGTTPATPLPARASIAAVSGNLPNALPVAAPRPMTTAEATPALSGVGMPLIPEQVIRPIDLPCALRLAGANDLDIAIAREGVAQAMAELQQARVMWLPSLYLGPNWIRHDGQAQTVQGPVQSISKSSLFLGATAAAGSSVSGPVPAGGPAQVSGLTSILRFSDAIFEPLAARQVAAARRAAIDRATNDALLGVAEAYMDLQLAAGTLAIAREAAANAETLAKLTSSYARTGAGLDADYRRAVTERDRQRKNVEAAVGDLEAASAELVRRTRLDPRLVVAPVEPPESVLRMVPQGFSLDELITTGLRNRPELAEAQALVQATLVRLKQAKLRPYIPSLAFRYSGGGFGGGTNSFFGDFASRSDADVNLYWEIQNLGFADKAIARQRAAQSRTACLEKLKVQDRVAAEVVQAVKGRIAASRRMQEAARAVPEALESLDLNLTNIRRGAGLPGATRPIEVLQPIQALALARTDYLAAVLAYNRSEFRLTRAVGRPPGVQAAPVAAGPPPARVAAGPDPSVDVRERPR